MQAQAHNITSLAQLCQMINEETVIDSNETFESDLNPGQIALDFENLPTFGGEIPSDVMGVYSCDEKNFMVWTESTPSFRIMTREEYREEYKERFPKMNSVMSSVVEYALNSLRGEELREFSRISGENPEIEWVIVISEGECVRWVDDPGQVPTGCHVSIASKTEVIKAMGQVMDVGWDA